MFKHIVVGVDGGEGGRDAVALARLLVAVGRKLTLAYVVARDAHAYRGTSGAPEASDGGRAEALLEAVREETGVEAHLRWYGSSSVGAVCMSCAEWSVPISWSWAHPVADYSGGF
jgi:nucleotide-binding universal stress UspA family protein